MDCVYAVLPPVPASCEGQQVPLAVALLRGFGVVGPQLSGELPVNPLSGGKLRSPLGQFTYRICSSLLNNYTFVEVHGGFVDGDSSESTTDVEVLIDCEPGYA